jgi:histidinol dehydrogenase
MSAALLACADWASATAAERARFLARPHGRNLRAFHEDVHAIAGQVRADGDRALLALAREHTGAVMESVAVAERELDDAAGRLAGADRAALDAAIANVERFHASQLRPPVRIETSPGVYCERVQRPIDAVGLYVPGGSAPLPSTAIMLAVPARIAGCRLRILCTPPRADGSCDPAVLYVARACGIARVQGGRRPGDRGHGIRHQVRAARGQDFRAGQCLGDGGKTAPVRRARGSRRRSARGTLRGARDRG